VSGGGDGGASRSGDPSAQISYPMAKLKGFRIETVDSGRILPIFLDQSKMALQRLSASWSNKRPSTNPVKATSQTDLALVYGRTDVPLWKKTLGDVIDEQAEQYGSKVAAVFPWQNHSLSYLQLAQRSRLVARAMLSMGLQHGDCVGILAGNCYQYLEVFLGGARIGCPVVVLNTTYSSTELKSALIQSGKSVQSYGIPC
jgi:non-ribosomal peptide synthetase component F